MNVLASHEISYIRRKGFRENRLTSDAFVPKEIWIENRKYVLYMNDEFFQVICQKVDKSKCLCEASGWVVYL